MVDFQFDQEMDPGVPAEPEVPGLDPDLLLDTAEAADTLQCSEAYFCLVHAPRLTPVVLYGTESDGEEILYLLGDLLQLAAEVSHE